MSDMTQDIIDILDEMVLEQQTSWNKQWVYRPWADKIIAVVQPVGETPDPTPTFVDMLMDAQMRRMVDEGYPCPMCHHAPREFLGRIEALRKPIPETLMPEHLASRRGWNAALDAVLALAAREESE